MYAHLVNYLVQYGQLPLPGLGTLQRSTEVPRYSVSDRSYQPASPAPVWVPAAQESPTVQPLAAYLSKQTGASEEESFDSLLQWTQKAAATCAAAGAYTLPGLGTLRATATDGLSFEPHPAFGQYLAPRAAAKIAHAGATHEMTVGDTQTDTVAMQQTLQEQEALRAEKEAVQWWWPALITGVIFATLLSLRLLGVL